MPWLMKAEPDERIVKGKDVKFSVDDFEEMGESPWDGVRSHEAKNIMKEKMKLGDKVLFYHSNCKTPGVYALAEISKEGYPDYTSWDPSHPYFDAKSDKDSPTWYMVSVRFLERLPHPVTLAGVKSLVGLAKAPAGVEYIGAKGLKAVQSMALINRGRLSVQPVEQEAYDAIVEIGRKGGLEVPKPSKAAKGKRAKDEDRDEAAETKKPATKKAKASSPGVQKQPSKSQPEQPQTQKAKGVPQLNAEPKPEAEPKPQADLKPRPESTGMRRSSRLKK